MNINLVEYLENVVNLEKSVYIQRHAIQEITNRINSLEIRYHIQEPMYPGVYQGDLLDGTLSCAFGGMIIGGIIGTFLGAVTLGMPIGAIAGFAWVYSSNKNEENAENEKREANYRREKERYDQILSAENARLDHERTEKQYLLETLKMMENKLQETTSVLDKYYALDIVFTKYRNLVSMCSIYEYFLSGRCTTLTGHEGAYNIFENEARFERIYTKLDEVISKLEDIKTNQYVLYDAIQEGNRTTRCLVDASIKQAQLCERIADNVEISAHYNRQTALEANQIKWLMLNQAWDNT